MQPAQAAPGLADYAVVLRFPTGCGRPSGFAPASTPLETYRLACEQGFPGGCRQACDQGDRSACATVASGE